MRRDARATHAALDWLRDLPRPAADAPRVLISLRREDVFDVKVSLMQGAAMKLEGARPVVLARHPRVPRIRRYARAFGVEEVRYRSRVPRTATEDAEIARLTAELIARHDDFATARGWTFRGHPLGERVLSTLIRQTVDGEPDLESAANRHLLDHLLRLALGHYIEAEKVLDEVAPRWLLADETGYADNGPLVDVALARGLDVIETSPYLREGALIFKRMNGSVGRKVSTSVAPETMAELERRPWTAEADAEVQAELEERYKGSTALQRMYQWNTHHQGRREISPSTDSTRSAPWWWSSPTSSGTPRSSTARTCLPTTASGWSARWRRRWPTRGSTGWSRPTRPTPSASPTVTSAARWRRWRSCAATSPSSPPRPPAAARDPR